MKYLILLVSFLLSIQAIGQTKFSWGLGMSYSTHFFIHEDKSQFENSFFKPDVAHLPRINSFFDLSTNSAFQFRFNLGLGEKKIVLSNKLNIPSTGGTFKISILHETISADFSILSYYSINDKKISKIRPLAGFYASMNQYTALTLATSTRNGQTDESSVTNGNYSSVNELESKIRDYVEYHNRCLAKPLNWKFKGFEKDRKLHNFSG